MRKINVIWAILLFATYAFASTETNNIQQTFEKYKSAILNNNGTLAYSVIDQNTRTYYDDLYSKSIFANKDEILSLGLLDRMQVIIMRHRIPPELLITMDGRKLFEYAVINGWVGKNSVTKLSIGKITVNGNFATSQVIVNGENTPLYFHFYKENSSWKIDISEMTKWGEGAFIHQQQNSGLSEQEFIFKLVQIVSGKPVNPKAIYLPLQFKISNT